MIPTIIIIAVGLLIPLVWVIVNYNRMARLRQHIAESWSDILVELRRRHELIPNLVETVKGYARHERETLERVVELRNRSHGTREGVAAQGREESALMLEVKKLFAIVERYPDLKADAGFLSLQQELRLTEDRIAAARRFFNANVREMNQLCQTFPTNLLASAFGFVGGDFFTLDSEAERAVPEVEL